MSHSSAKSARVVNVASGVQTTDRATPVRDGRHQALAVLIGNWINEGATIAAADVPSVPIRTSDVYEWVPGGFFVVYTAFGKIGDTSVGGVSIIGVDGDAYDDMSMTASATRTTPGWRSTATCTGGSAPTTGRAAR